jgi:hypothetical protein
MSSGANLLMRAEAADGYRRKCAESLPNAMARRGEKYSPFFVSQDHSDRLQKEIFKIDLLNGANVLILHSSADNGYPHTRPQRIVCLPENFVTSSTNESLAETLSHEAIHLHQRQYPELWKQKCMDEGWLPIDVKEIPLRFREQCRINPDTMSCPFWAWDRYHVPLPMFRDDSPQNLGDIRIEWLDLRTLALFHEPPASFTEKYRSPPQPEHPYEIYAVIYAQEGIRSHNALYIKLVTSQ